MSLSESLVRSSRGAYSVQFDADATAVLSSLRTGGNVLVADRRVVELYPRPFEGFRASGRFIPIEADEGVKSYSGLGGILERLVELGVRRSDTIIAAGGGIVQDTASFAASILLRGVDWVFMPTTLLAMADSCIGGKTSINLGPYKNQLGTFHPPRSVIVDSQFLDTLSRDEIQSGLGEMLHYYIYADSPFLSALANDYDRLLVDRTLLREHIKESLSIKKRVIEVDEFDRHERRKFNYGHTFGHALEAAVDFKVQHGQAVTVGMHVANDLSMQLGMLESGEGEEIARILRKNFPRTEALQFSLDRYIDLLKKDKKNSNAGLVCILCGGRGKLVVHETPLDESFRGRLASALSRAGLNVI